MDLQLLFAVTATIFAILIPVVIMRRLLPSRGNMRQSNLKGTSNPSESTMISKSLILALPESVILPNEAVTFTHSMNSYWARQECDVIPSCVVRPRNSQELCTAVTLLKQEYDKQVKAGEIKAEGLFAVRAGGHSPIPHAATIKGGVLIDLSLFNEVTPSKDRSSVIIGAGNKWGNVSKVLDSQGLAVVGGRNSAVGVGGLVLGGGISFFSPRFGFVCSNVVSYEVVLPSGSLVTASESANPDLWRALQKGGSNNFGIVTRFTVRSFPSGNIWSGLLYMPSFQTTKVLTTFHEYVNRVGSTESDAHAAGPIACFSYVSQLGIEIISVNLVYTGPFEKKSPDYWKSFKSLWRIWSTCKVRSLTSATDELSALNPPGRRQVFANTTIKNDPATLTATHEVYRNATTSLRSVKGLVWTLVLQPLFTDWLQNDDKNLHEPLVLVSFTINWDRGQDDELVNTMTRKAIEDIDAVAVRNGTAHSYRFLNYCAHWQNPFQSYGEEYLQFLQDVSQKYDPDRMFQRGCVGGFKLFE